jgi:Protein of unknown function (DUF5131)
VRGKDAPRHFFGDAHCNEPGTWNRKAREARERRRVFCTSMADVFADRDDAGGRQMDEARRRLWVLIGTPHLDWLLLTKRPAGMHRMLPRKLAALLNVWPEVTVERRTTSGGPRSSRLPRYGLRGFGIGTAADPARVVSPEASGPTGSPARSGSPHGRRTAGIPSETREIRSGG